MAETPTGGRGATREDRTADTTDDGVTVQQTTVERDREFARQMVLAGLAWALIWSIIIAGLFLFGDAISAKVV